MTEYASHRLLRLREHMSEEDLDGFLVSSAPNRRYLSGFTGSNGYLVITATEAVLATDFRYIEQAQAESPGFEVCHIRGGESWFPNLVDRLELSSVGFEADDMSVSAFSRLLLDIEEFESDLQLEFEETAGVIEWIRAVKDDNEIEALDRAVQIADEAMAKIRSEIRVGMTEREVAWELHKEMRRLGANGPSFDTIVAVGPNAALPHHRADDTVVRARRAYRHRHGRELPGLLQRPDPDVRSWRAGRHVPAHLWYRFAGAEGRDRSCKTGDDRRGDRLRGTQGHHRRRVR